MPRKQKFPEPPPGIPSWFMTYSDVVTLLMTFFILLLTFATNEPETFERVQSAVFGGSRGIAGTNSEGVDREAIVVRCRPDVSRIAMKGSTIPPMYTDPPRESVEVGLRSLDDVGPLVDRRFVFNVVPSMFVDHGGQLTALARQQLDLLGRQMQRLPLFAHFAVAHEEDVPAAVLAMQQLVNASGINPGRLSVEWSPPAEGGGRAMRIVVSQRTGAEDVVGASNVPEPSAPPADNP